MKPLYKFMLSILVISLLTILSACESLETITKGSLSSYAITQDIKSGRVQSVIHSVDHSDKDHERLQSAHDMYLEFNEKWDGKISSSYKSIPNALGEELLIDYDTLIIPAYMIIDSVVRRDWDKYSETNQAYLLMYQRYATDTNTAVEDYRNLRVKQSAVFSALRFAEIVGSMVIDHVKD